MKAKSITSSFGLMEINYETLCLPVWNWFGCTYVVNIPTNCVWFMLNFGSITIMPGTHTVFDNFQLIFNWFITRTARVSSVVMLLSHQHSQKTY